MPPVAVTLNAAVPPIHCVIAVGCVLIVGSATITIVATLLVTLPHPFPLALTIQ